MFKEFTLCKFTKYHKLVFENITSFQPVSKNTSKTILKKNWHISNHFFLFSVKIKIGNRKPNKIISFWCAILCVKDRETLTIFWKIKKGQICDSDDRYRHVPVSSLLKEPLQRVSACNWKFWTETSSKSQRRVE